MEHDEQADQLEREAERLEHEGDRVDQHIDKTRSDWEQKEHDVSVPGAQPDPAAEAEGDEDMESSHEESDQLPEDAPPEQVEDDTAGEARDEAEENPGVPGEDDTSTGNPDAAGSEE